jgi:hypothetical protein
MDRQVKKKAANLLLPYNYFISCHQKKEKEQNQTTRIFEAFFLTISSTRQTNQSSLERPRLLLLFYDI